MGNMGQQHLGHAISAASLLQQLRDMWKSPRGTVLRIEALALLAIFLSFFLAVFGSCRRWSNHFLIQKGFLAANALFLSLGTYSIGLMQSSPVKSEMYPIWAVSLLALLCCVDSAAASGLDNENQLWKMLYQLCLYFGYVMLMSFTTISSDISNTAICVLATLTFIKGFHRSMALVLPSSMRNMIREIPASRITTCSFRDDGDDEIGLIVDRKLDVMTGHHDQEVYMGDIASTRCEEGNTRKVESDIDACKDVCLSFSLSHLLHRRLLGLSSIEQITTTRTQPLVRNFKRAFKVVEVELAFLYDILYTSNTFLHYYEAKSASIWAFALVVGICFLGAAALVPGARTGRHASPAGTMFVNTTTADYVITGVILVSLALLQVLQLLHCWASNWARVAFACDYARRGCAEPELGNEMLSLSWEMRLRASLLKMSWFDDKYYLWQNKLGQHSVIALDSIRMPGIQNRSCYKLALSIKLKCTYLQDKCHWYLKSLLRPFGLLYISRELQEMLQGCSTESPVDLHPDVKAYIGDFVGNKIRSHEVSDWASSSVDNGQGDLLDFSVTLAAEAAHAAETDDMTIYVSCILMWHIATCYCELALQRDGDGHLVDNKDHRVATDLSKYCAYLVASAPRLLPGRSETTKLVYAQVEEAATMAAKIWTVNFSPARDKPPAMNNARSNIIVLGVYLGLFVLQSMAPADRWKVLAEFWVKALVYAAPSDNVEEHMQRLSQGGELITHLWAILYHAGIHKWQLNPPQDNFKMGWDYIFQIGSWKDLDRASQGSGSEDEKDRLDLVKIRLFGSDRERRGNR